jgi:hypothetical protein
MGCGNQQGVLKLKGCTTIIFIKYVLQSLNFIPLI